MPTYSNYRDIQFSVNDRCVLENRRFRNYHLYIVMCTHTSSLLSLSRLTKSLDNSDNDKENHTTRNITRLSPGILLMSILLFINR